jgi:hypothetical protein
VNEFMGKERESINSPRVGEKIGGTLFLGGVIAGIIGLIINPELALAGAALATGGIAIRANAKESREYPDPFKGKSH